MAKKMKFKVNGVPITVRFGNAKKGLKPDANIAIVFGRYYYSHEIIYVNECLSDENALQCFIHELTHCFLWHSDIGCSNREHFTEEEVVNFAQNNFCAMWKIIKRFKNEMLGGNRV